MGESERIITAAEMDQMTPNERAATVNERSVTDLDSLSPEFRAKVEATARGLADELRAQRTA